MPPRARVQARQRRTKACDLCFSKKIKCDKREPQCSNCKLYHRECRRSTTRKEVESPQVIPGGNKSRPASRPANSNSDLETAPNLSDNAVQQPEPVSTEASTPPVDSSTDRSHNANNQTLSHGSSWRFDPINPSLYFGSSDDSLRLPPLKELMPAIDHFFSGINVTLPIFDQVVFMKTVRRWFSAQPKRDRSSWASILVVMALGLQSMPDEKQNRPKPVNGESWMDYCIRNAQSTLPELMARDEDLLGVQVIVSLALLFQSAVDLRPSSILIGMAVRIIQRMQLHRNDAGHHFSEDEALQRSNVFWAAYILDKDVSLRLKAPSLLSDDDINIAVPDHNSSTQGGLVYSQRGDVSFNLFHQRVKLAQIESKIYSLLCSNQFLELEPKTRQDRVTHLDTVLQQWYCEIPAAFKPGEGLSSLKPVDLAQATYLLHTYLFCHICTHGLWSSRSDWMGKIGSFSKAAIEDIMVAIQGPRVTTCLQLQEPPSTQGWNHCISATQEAMKLFHQAPRTSSLAWQCTCAQFSGMIILLADIINHPNMASKAQDLELVKASMKIYGRFLEDAPSQVHDSLNLILDDLLQRASDHHDGDGIEQSFEIDTLASYQLEVSSSETFLPDALPELGYEDIQAAMNFGFHDVVSPYLSEENIFFGP